MAGARSFGRSFGRGGGRWRVKPGNKRDCARRRIVIKAEIEVGGETEGEGKEKDGAKGEDTRRLGPVDMNEFWEEYKSSKLEQAEGKKVTGFKVVDALGKREPLVKNFDKGGVAVRGGVLGWQPSSGLALGRRLDMEMGADTKELETKDKAFENYYRRGDLPGFRGNIRDLTKSQYNDPDDPNPRVLRVGDRALTSEDKRNLRRQGKTEESPKPVSEGYFNSPPSLKDTRTAAQKMAEYEALKQELVLITAAFGVLLTPIICLAYSLDAGASFGVGSVGSIVYVRLLAKVTDSLPSADVLQATAQSPGDVAGGALGSQRILIPVILILGYNRFNALVGDDIGVHLQAIPILLGFFNYKVATVLQAFKDVKLVDEGKR